MLQRRMCVFVGMFRQELLCSDSFTFLRQTAEKELAFVSLVSFSSSLPAFSLSLANYFGSKDTRARCKNTGDRGLKHTSGEELGEPFSRVRGGTDGRHADRHAAERAWGQNTKCVRDKATGTYRLLSCFISYEVVSRACVVAQG